VRIRTVKPALFSSRTTSKYPDAVFRTFVGLFCYADDYGRAEDDTELIKAGVWPRVRRITPAKIADHLEVFTTGEDPPICRYSVNGVPYFHFLNWRDHQRVNRPSKPVIPPCPTHESEGQFQ
jgi:hypothetical protein